MNKKTYGISLILSTLLITTTPATAMSREANNYFLLKRIIKIQSLIKNSLKKASTNLALESWQLPELCKTWDPRLHPYAPTTLQGCFMEFCGAMPRSLITPWGRIILISKENHPVASIIMLSLVREITLGKECTDLSSFWNTENDTRSNVFEIHSIKGVELQKPILRKHINEATAQQINLEWNATKTIYKKEKQEIYKQIQAILNSRQ